MTLLLVALGGAVGAALRYLVTISVAFPYGTLAVNVAGSFLMGVALVLIAERGLDRMALFAMTGVLGGFTTFSAFSLDVVRLYEQGAIAGAAAYIVCSVLLSLAAIALAIVLIRALAA